FELTRSFGAEVRTYDIARDHETGERDRLTREIAEGEGAIQASPYDDPHVIAGNGVGALEVVRDLKREGRGVSHFFCPVSGGGLAGRGRPPRAPPRPGSSASSPRGGMISAARWPPGSASVSTAPPASATACCPTTWASTTGRSCGGS